MDRPKLTPEAFDMIASMRPDRILWTLPTIARRIGTSADFVRDTLAKMDDTPVRILGGRYFAFEGDLIAFMRSDRLRPDNA